MKRIVCLIVLMAFSAPASARDSYFTFHGHRIHISGLRHCRSLSCIRLSIPGLGVGRHNRDRDADAEVMPDQVSPPAPVAAPAPPPAPPVPVAPPAPPPPTQTTPAPAPGTIQAQLAPAPAQPRPLSPVIAQVPMSTTRTPAGAAQGAAAPTLAAATPEQSVRPHLVQSPARQETTASTPGAPPSVGFEVQKPQPPTAATEKGVAAAPDKPAPKPIVSTPATVQPQPNVGSQVASAPGDGDDDPADTPLGDWQTDGKNGLVRIEACGASLCGYVLNASTMAKGETILVNMKPKSGLTWSGNIFSRTSGNMYYGTITMKEPNTLRVEACALGKFICSGNNWTRIERDRPSEDKRVTARPSPSRS